MNKRKMFIALATAVVAIGICAAELLTINRPVSTAHVVMKPSAVVSPKPLATTHVEPAVAAVVPETPVVPTPAPTTAPAPHYGLMGNYPLWDAHNWICMDRLQLRAPQYFTNATTAATTYSFIKATFGPTNNVEPACTAYINYVAPDNQPWLIKYQRYIAAQ